MPSILSPPWAPSKKGAGYIFGHIFEGLAMGQGSPKIRNNGIGERKQRHGPVIIFFLHPIFEFPSHNQHFEGKTSQSFFSMVHQTKSVFSDTCHLGTCPICRDLFKVWDPPRGGEGVQPASHLKSSQHLVLGLLDLPPPGGGSS